MEEDLVVTAVAASRRTRRCSELSWESMDGRLWGRLGDHIDLATAVYARLPIGDFFRLRLVCKEWNWLASDKEFLDRTIPRAIPSPYFVIKGTKQCGHGLYMGSWPLQYERCARGWSWTRLPPWDCEVGGLLFSDSMMHVFNVHTRVFHKLPPPSEPEASKRGQRGHLVGMTVAGSATGQHRFQVTLYNFFLSARIYSSDSGWKNSTRELNHKCIGRPRCRAHSDDWIFAASGSILHLRESMLFQQINTSIFHTYDLVQGKCELQHSMGLGMLQSMVNYDIGAWQSRVFIFGLRVENDRPIIKAWEHLSKIRPGTERDVVLFDRMPDDVCKWMLGDKIKDNPDADDDVIEMHTRFTGEYVLVYASMKFGYVAERAVLYNLEHKTWEQVEVPAPITLVAIGLKKPDHAIRALT